MIQYNWSARNGIRQLVVGLGITTAALTLNFISQEQAFAGAFGYAYQQVSALKITSGFTGYSFTSSTSGNASVNATGSSLSNAYDTQEATVGTVGLGNNFGFFSNPAYNPFDNPLPTNGTPTGFDAPPSSSQGLVNGNYGRGDARIYNGTTAITNDIQLNTAIFGATGLYFANVAESYVVTASESTGVPGILQTQGNARGDYSLTSSDFTVNGVDDFITFSLDDYRNELYTELTTNTPAGAPNLNQATASVAFIITLNTVSGNTVTPVGEFRPSTLQQNVGQTDMIGVNTTAINPLSGPGSDPLTHTFSGLDTSGNTTYRIVLTASEVVDTRLLTGPDPASIPEPSSVVALFGLGSLGLLIKRKKDNT